MADFYGQDLAYVHDAGFGDFARDAAPGIVAMLRGAGIDDGLVVDLGCGSGILAAELIERGYDVLGVDLSADALAIARRRAPGARFEEASVIDFEVPPCAAVTAIGEVLGYAADERASRDSLREIFGRVARALSPGGLFLLDLAGPGREPEPRREWREGDGWVICYAALEDSDSAELLRHIIVFRETDGGWRRSLEDHLVRLHSPDAVLTDLGGAGFEARLIDGYAPGDPFPHGLAGYRAIYI